MSFEIHREPLYRRYYTPLLSGSCCYAIACGFILIFLPLILAYNSTDFWIKETVVYEQPSVEYEYQTLLQLRGKSNDEPLNLFYSTDTSINNLYSSTLRIPLFKSAELDDDRDGRTDRVEMSFQMPLAPTEMVSGVTALSYFKVTLKNRVKYIFDAVSVVDYDSSSFVSQLDVDGDLKLRQTWPLVAKGGYKVPYAGNSLIDVKAGMSAADVSISKILQSSAARNVSMKFEPTFAIASGLYSPNYQQPTGAHFFNGSVTIRIPASPVRYTPQMSVVLKDAWIQYIAFFAVISFLVFRLNSFVFRHQLLSTYPVTDIVYEKMD